MGGTKAAVKRSSKNQSNITKNEANEAFLRQRAIDQISSLPPPLPP